MSTIRIINGSYRNQPVNNTVFTLVKGFQTGKKGSYVTVKNEGHFEVDIAEIKIKVEDIEAIQYLSGSTETATKVEHVENKETDAEAMDRIANRFSVLDEMSKACINGDIRAMIVSGPPGVGKSFGVTRQMEKASLFDQIASKRTRFEIVKGAMSGIGLFATLYKFSDPKNVLVFDDCDVWEDQDALNVLKGALDSGKNRRISWNKDSRLLREEGVPNSFNFQGSVIFITNLKFDSLKSQKLRDHLDALQSRCHYLDLTLDTMRDKILRIRQIASDGVLFADYNFDEIVQDDIIEFMDDNKIKLREMSLRMALKIADLRKMSVLNWKRLAETTCMKPANT